MRLAGQKVMHSGHGGFMLAMLVSIRNDCTALSGLVCRALGRHGLVRSVVQEV